MRARNPFLGVHNVEEQKLTVTKPGAMGLFAYVPDEDGARGICGECPQAARRPLYQSRA